MVICFLAPSGNYHTIKWARWFVSHGHTVHVISFTDAPIEGAAVHYIDPGVGTAESDGKKIRYLLQAGKVRRLLKEIKPDIVNAHFATSYGTVAALSGVRRYVLSVWGADVYDFPGKSPLHRALLQFSLFMAPVIFSTSRAMAEELKKYTRKKVYITPFGVDMNLFHPDQGGERSGGGFVIGTVKALVPKYGIDELLRAAAFVRKERPDIPLRVRIAGSGACEEEYRQLAKDLGIDSITGWLGFIPQERAAEEWADMDVGVVASVLESESFGVSAVEAEASGTPVIISDIPGLMEATRPGVTSVVVPRRNSRAIGEAVIDLYDHPDKREAMGSRGRQYVEKRFELNHCFERVEKLFDRYVKS